MWGVWKCTCIDGDVTTGDFIADFSTKVQAENFVYKMNGWTK